MFLAKKREKTTKGVRIQVVLKQLLKHMAMSIDVLDYYQSKLAHMGTLFNRKE